MYIQNTNIHVYDAPGSSIEDLELGFCFSAEALIVLQHVLQLPYMVRVFPLHLVLGACKQIYECMGAVQTYGCTFAIRAKANVYV